MHDKKSLLEKITPKAVLRATTDEAKHAIGKRGLGEGLIGIWQFPFRIGRESRTTLVEGKTIISERHKHVDDGEPHNDIYLVDSGEKLFISREHLQIEKDGSGYKITDRQSACGTMINDNAIGSNDEGGNYALKDGDTVKIGGHNSPYQFEFISFEEI